MLLSYSEIRPFLSMSGRADPPTYDCEQWRQVLWYTKFLNLQGIPNSQGVHWQFCLGLEVRQDFRFHLIALLL